MTVRGRRSEADILTVLRRSRHGPMRARDIARALDVPPSEYRRFRRALSALVAAGRVYRVKGHRYAVPDTLDVVVGTLDVTRAGDGFVRPDRGGGDVFVRATDLGSAMHGDRVAVRIESRPRGRSPVGRVIKVVERVHRRIVGTFHRSRKVAFVAPLERRLGRNVVVPVGAEGRASDGDVVVVRIDTFGDGKLPPVGGVVRVLGPLSDPGVDVLAIAHTYDLPMEFPDDVLDSAATVAERSPCADTGHVDRTDLLVFTIDPSDARDHDDALSVAAAEEGVWEVGVHIADVAFYVDEGGLIDREARERGTSVYLVDRVVPMLPERLSGDVCSLRPGAARAAVSLYLRFGPGAELVDHRFERTVVRSQHRLDYETVQAVLDGAGSVAEPVDRAIRRLDDLARAIRKRRFSRGALDLNRPEARVLLDGEGRPTDIQRIDRLESHRLVEDFMILANEVVAGKAVRREIPVLYRIHEPPEIERMDELRELVGRFGQRVPRGRVRPGDLQALLRAVRGRPEEALVSNVVLRSLKRAEYSAENVGHFGLASPAYLHFTSPIRRYPDLVVHRAVIRTLVEGKPPREVDPPALDAVAEHASAREKAADDAERDSIELKKVEFMERHLGGTFDAHITGVQSFGFFVTLDAFFVDGLVHVNTLTDDFYRFQDRAYQLVGNRTRKRFRLGDRVRVQVARVDKEERHVDFVLVRTLSRQV